MADYSDPKRATAYRFTMSLFAQSDNQIKTAPTLAAGDVKVSKDNGATANITTLPSEAPASSGILQVDLSATEMTADLVTVTFIDASGAEWNSVAVNIAPAVRQMADLAYPTVSGRSLDVTATGAAGIDWANVENPTTALNLSGTNIDVDQVVAAVSGAVGSVTGAVGSVTGAVGSVTGSVGSVVGHTAQTGDTFALANGATGFAAIDTVVDAILVDTGTSIPDTLAGIGNSGGAAISADAAVDNFAGGITGVTSGTTVVGTQAATTYANTSFDDGVYHDITHVANTLDVVYQFLTGGGTSPVSVTFNGYLSSGNDTVTVSAWDHGVTGDWEAIGTISGQNGTVDLVKTLSLFTRHIGTSAAELGKIYIRLNCTGTSPVLHVDQLFVDYAVTSRSVGYANGEVWIDTVSGVAGTEDFVNGVADNSVLTLADALTIATSVGLRKFWVGNGSTITLAATTANKVFEGHEWTLDLNGQNIAESMFIDAEVTGTSTGADAEFEDCIFGTSSMVAYQAYNCSYTGTQTFSAAGNYRFINCQSGVPGSGAPTFALGTGAMNIEFRRWSGGMTLTGIGADDVITISGELGTIDLSGATVGTVEIRGTYKALTNASSGVTVNVAGAILGGDVASVLADTNELQTDWADGGRLDLILDSAAAAGDPWSTALPGAYGAGTAGKIIGDNINAPIATVQTSVDDLPTNAELATALAAADDAVLAAVSTVDGNVDAIKAKTDSLTFTVAGQVDANIQYVNDVQVTGNGETGTEWGPV